MVETLRISVLGSPILQFGERPLTADLISLKGQALLVYLAVTQRAHTRTSLSGLLWGDLPEESARANLRLTLSKLRKILPATILPTTHLDVRLVDFWLDTAEFEQQLPTIHNSQLIIHDSTFSLYRGDFLTGFDLPHAPEFETWLLGVRERLRQTAVTHLYKLVETAVHAQHAPPGIQAARQLLTIEPWHEETHRQLMRLLAADGQRSAALAQYETCRRLLDEELGVQPSSETQSLYQELLDDKVTRWQGDNAHLVTLSPRHPAMSSSRTPSHNLPTQFTPFIGRREAVADLTELVQNGRSRLITILGEGGVGKTRLALAAANQLLPDFPDGSWFVPLANVEYAPSTDAEDSVASAIAAALGLNFSPGEPPKQQLANYLRQRHTLLILDNFEPLLTAAGLLLNLLATAQKLAILATSRESLKVQAERIFRLEGLHVPQEEDWETAVATDSLQLFAERTERATGRNLLTPDNLPQIAALCRFVNGLPLGIELMADWTRWLSLEAIAADLQTNLLHLARAPQDVPERHRSLQAVFNYSWHMLTPDERNTLAQLSVFQGSFQLDGVRAVTNSQPASLFALIDKSLVQHHGGDFYHLHELLRTFAQSKLAEQAIDPNQLQDRHARHYLTRLAQRTALFFGPEPQIALHQTQAEAENLLKAWQWSVERPLPSELLPAIPALGVYWNYTGLFREGDTLLQAARHRLGDWPHLQAALAAEHATLLYELTQLDEMQTAAQTCLELALQVGDELLVANGRFRLGQYFWRTSRYADAEKELAEAYQIAQRLGQTNLAGMIARSQAANAWRQANLAAAEQLARHSAELHQKANDIRSLGRTHYFLAILKKEQQSLGESRAYAEPIIDVAQNIGDRVLEVSVVGFLGHIATYEGRYEQALDYMSRQRQLSEENGRLYDLASVLSNMGDLWLRLGQFERCAPFYQQSLELLRQLNTKQAQSNVLAYMGLLAAMQERWEDGRSLCEEALQLALAESVPREIAFAHTFLGHNLCGLGQWDAAQTAYEQAIAGWEKLGDTSRQMEAIAGQVRALLRQNKLDEAKTAVAPLITHLQTGSLSGANDPVRIYLTCHALFAEEDAAQARKWLRQGKTWLDQRATTITDPALRKTFLNAISSHRELGQLLSP